jgi:hypothetical protein
MYQPPVMNNEKPLRVAVPTFLACTNECLLPQILRYFFFPFSFLATELTYFLYILKHCRTEVSRTIHVTSAPFFMSVQSWMKGPRLSFIPVRSILDEGSRRHLVREGSCRFPSIYEASCTTSSCPSAPLPLHSSPPPHSLALSS